MRNELRHVIEEASGLDRDLASKTVLLYMQEWLDRFVPRTETGHPYEMGWKDAVRQIRERVEKEAEDE